MGDPALTSREVVLVGRLLADLGRAGVSAGVDAEGALGLDPTPRAALLARARVAKELLARAIVNPERAGTFGDFDRFDRARWMHDALTDAAERGEPTEPGTPAWLVALGVAMERAQNEHAGRIAWGRSRESA